MTIKGHYNGSVVVLDEPAPVDHEVEVQVSFPASATALEGDAEPWWRGKFHWAMPRPEGDTSSIDSTDIIRRMRDED